MVNKVILIGNLGRDPEVRHFENGGMIANFSVATSENYKDRSGEWQKITEWHNVVVSGPAAERTPQNLHKGSLVYIEGKLRTRKWQDKDGNERTSVEVLAQSYRPLEKRENSGGGQEGYGGAPYQASQPAPRMDAPAIEDSLNNSSMADDDLPF